MQVRKQQLELDKEQQTGCCFQFSKLEKEDLKAELGFPNGSTSRLYIVTLLI